MIDGHKQIPPEPRDLDPLFIDRYGGVMKRRVIPPPGIDPVFVPLACEVPRPFSSSLVQRVQGFFCTKRAPVGWKRLPELFVSPLLWWWRPSQQHSRSGLSTHSLPGPVPSV